MRRDAEIEKNTCEPGEKRLKTWEKTLASIGEFFNLWCKFNNFSHKFNNLHHDFNNLHHKLKNSPMLADVFPLRRDSFFVGV